MGQVSAILPMIAGGIGGGAQATAAILGGNATNAADQERAIELKQQAALVKTQAEEQQAVRQTELQRTVGAINATVASRGLSTLSPSSQAYIGGVNKTAYLDTTTLGANAAIQAGILNESARAAILAGENAQTNSWFTALGSLTQSGEQFLPH